MGRLGAALANRSWELANGGHERAFRAALADPAAAQWRLLTANLRANAGTWFGRRHGFGQVRSLEQFRRQVPISAYEDYEEALGRVRRGERGVLTAEPVLRLQPTSGSTAGTKWIAYTRSLRGELHRAVGAWVVDLFRRHPALRDGRAYWSISPATPAPEETSAVPLGFADDSEYLGGVAGWLARRTFAVPPETARLPDVDAFRRATLFHLLAAADLALVSVWHPSFLALLLDALPPAWESLLQKLAGLHPARARQLGDLDPRAWTAIWPRLAVVSCWADAQAAAPAAELAARLPGVTVQPKGLMATEGVLSIPFAGRRPVAVTSHFLELLDDQDRCHGVEEVEPGGEYTLALTTGGGLYRYRLGDRVRVTGFLERAPCLELLGRDDLVSDLAGEKLSEAFVARALADIFGAFAPQVAFAQLAAEQGAPPRYRLLLECRADPPAELAQRLDRALCANPHYAYCRRLGQLGEIEVRRLAAGAHADYLERHRRMGRRLGEIKPAALEGVPR